MKTGSKADVFASQDTILSTTSVLNAPQVNSMMFTKESAESNAEPTRYTTSTLENATAPKASTSSKVSAPNANLESYMTNTKENASPPSVQVSTNSTQSPPKLVCASLNTSASKEYAPTAHLDTTMIATVTDVSANLATSREQDSVRLSVPATKPMSTENVNATTAFLCLTANALLHSSAHLTVNLTVLQATVSARQDFQ